VRCDTLDDPDFAHSSEQLSIWSKDKRRQAVGYLGLKAFCPSVSGFGGTFCLLTARQRRQQLARSISVRKYRDIGIRQGVQSLNNNQAICIVSIDRELMNMILEGARNLYPRESMLILRGKKSKNTVKITDLLVPPLANYGRGYTQFQLHRLPMDFSIVGTMHSHPSGSANPSNVDLNHFMGNILMIAAYPFADENNIAIYTRNGERATLQVTQI
jgi:proteasome lid subunit RPN8/RPN11